MEMLFPMALLNVIWDIDPIIVQFGPVQLRWYGLLFSLGFVLGYPLMQSFYRREGKNPMQVDTLAMYMIISTIIGARLGHVIFYQPEIFLDNPLRVFATWEGGLASHGAAIGILFALWLYGRKHKDQPYLWVVDRIVITVALAGAFIRLGNLMNSEIYGHETDLPWGFVFVRAGENVPKHPTAIYETICYLISFGILYGLYRRMGSATPRGFLLGAFLVLIFTARFFIEFYKEDQVAFEANMPLNMGQLLSIPFVAIGFWLVSRQWQAFRTAWAAGPPADKPWVDPIPAKKPVGKAS